MTQFPIKFNFKFLLFIVTLAAFSACSSTLKKFTVADGTVYSGVGHPIMKFEKFSHDFGKIVKGEDRTIIYKFVNVGDTDLEIELVTGCDCTTLEWPEAKVFKPGEGGEIKATFHSGKAEEIGKVEKTIDIIANTNPIIVELKYQAEVQEK